MSLGVSLFLPLFLLAACGVPGPAPLVSAVENALPPQPPPPPQPPASALPRLWEEIANVKAMMAIISDELSRFNTLYLGKLEHRMLAIATSLSSVDSNVKNLQERAHVWDTFQLHVAAWNEQIKTLDKKVDILSRGHEKLDLMDGKLGGLLSLDYKVERVAGQIERTDNKLSALGRSVENQRGGATLFGDVATRGIVSTLRIIERKLDRVNSALAATTTTRSGTGGGGSGNGGRGKGRNKDMEGHGGSRSSARAGPAAAIDEETAASGAASISSLGRGRLVIRCNAPVAAEEILRDVSSKVDVMFDKMVAASSEVETEPRLLHEAHRVAALRDLAEDKTLERLWKRLTSPFKRTARALESLQGTVRTMANESAAAAAFAAAPVCAAACASAAEGRLDVCASTATSSVVSRMEERLDRMEVAANVSARRMEERLTKIEAVCTTMGNKEMLGRNNRSNEDTDERQCVPTKSKSSVPQVYPQDVPSVTDVPVNTDEESASGDGDLGGSDIEPPFIPVVERTLARSCEDLFATIHIRHSGIYQLGGHETNLAGRDFYTRFCDMQTNGGGWTVIQRRGYFHGAKQNFSLSWDEYKTGFGDLDKEFWFGNDFIHRLTYQKEMILRVELESFSNKKVWAEYSSFRVGSVESNYRLTVGGYTGNATNSLVAHDGALFSTIDKTNDAAPSCCPCAPSYGGGWWFDSCFEANLNGVYYTPRDRREEFRGIIWEHWLGDESLKSTEMKIRPKIMPVIAGKEDPSFDDHSSSPDDVNPLDIPEDP